MKVGIMQPYFLPYIGYYQMMAAVDKFVILDDVNYIRKGWINRNFIMIGGGQHWLTIPLSAASQNVEIRSLEIAPDTGWKIKMKRSIERAYRRTPLTIETMEMVSRFLEAAEGNLSDFLRMTLQEVCRVLKIETPIVSSSALGSRDGFKGQDKIIRLCTELQADTYVNLPGGRSFYQNEPFKSAGIELCFIDQTIPPGRLSSGLGDSPYISILDLLMRNSHESVRSALTEFTITAKT